MAPTSKLLCCLLLVGLLACQHTKAQDKPAENELKFKGLDATNNEDEAASEVPSVPTPSNGDNNNNINYNNRQPEVKPTAPFSPLHQLMMPFDLGPFMGPSFERPSFERPSRRRPASLFDSLLGGGSLFDHLERHSRDFEREFSSLERQAGEGQDVSYFNRNGVAYVRSCTTRRVQNNERPAAIDFEQTPGGQQQRPAEQQKPLDQQQPQAASQEQARESQQ